MLTIYKYSDLFVDKFEKESKKLFKILGEDCLIEHIGSTAIPGVDGKGIIDIMLVFEKFEDVESSIKLLLDNGYFLPIDGKDRKGRVFMTSVDVDKKSDFGDVHLHLTTKDNDSYLGAVLFRDYLKKHSKEKKEYVDLKYQLLKNVSGDRIKYTELKNDFIKKIIFLAKNN